jgi:TonB family protein
MSWRAFLEQNALRGMIVLTMAFAAASAEPPAAAASPAAWPAAAPPPAAETAPEPPPAAQSAPAAAPQSASGDLYGVVRDPSQAVVPNCRVSLRSLDGSSTSAAVTNAAGGYRISGLSPGPYVIEFRQPGFLIARYEVAVAAGVSTQAGVNLEIGHGAEAISVTASRPAPAAAPQSATGSLHGVVRHSAQDALQNCWVSARSLERSSMLVAVTNAAGEYHIPGVPPGRYALEFHAAGFLIARNEVIVAPGLSTEDSVNLEIAPVTESISPTPLKLLGAAPAPEPQGNGVGGNVQPFSLIRKVNPAYPEDLRQAGIEGRVVVRAIISKDGGVLRPWATSADAHPRLVEAAIDAVRQWKFHPTLLNGQPIETPTEIAVDFRLQ